MKPVFQLYMYKNVSMKEKDWIKLRIKISCKHKRSLYTVMKKKNDPIANKILHEILYNPLQVIKEAKNQHYFSLIAKFSNKITMTWTIIRN